MKRFLLLIVVVIATLNSCSLDDDNDATQSFDFEIMPIESVEMPQEFMFGATHEIFMDYIKPTSCHVFNDFLYQINGQERIVGIINTLYTDNICAEDPKTVTVSFQFNVTNLETYVFKFYQGEDEEGVDQYLIMEVPVVE
jgi:hypothetical protein